RKKAAAQNGQQYKTNPEIDAKIDAFAKANPDLVKSIQGMSREHLERKVLLGKMREQEQRDAYTVKVKGWLNKPEQADLLKSLRATVSPNMKPEQQERAVVTQAKNYIRNS